MTIKKEYWVGGLILVGVAIYLMTKKDGVLSSATINGDTSFSDFSGEDDSFADMADENVFAKTKTLNLNNLTK
jgi:hypothetical protein